MPGAAHRGVLTSTPSRVCEDGRLDDFFARQRSRTRSSANQIVQRYRRRMRELADSTDQMQMTTRGPRQPTGPAYGQRVAEDE